MPDSGSDVSTFSARTSAKSSKSQVVSSEPSILGDDDTETGTTKKAGK